MLDERRQLAFECQQSIQRARIVTLDDPRSKLKELEADFLVITTNEDLSEEGLREAKGIFDEMVTLVLVDRDYEARLKVIEAAIQAGWFLAENCPISISAEVIETNIEMVETMRECHRQLAQSLTKSDWLKGTNYARLAVLKNSSGDLDGAIENAIEAQHAFRKAVQLRPRNRIWANDKICLQLLLGDWLVEKEELADATKTFIDAVMNSIRISKSFPGNFEMQKRTIKMFVKMADVGVKRKLHGQAIRDYYVVVKDCQLLLLQEEQREWAFPIRLWVLSKALEQLKLEPNEDALAILVKNENGVIETWQTQYSDETTLMQAVLDGELQPERPGNLEFNTITKDILAGN